MATKNESQTINIGAVVRHRTWHPTHYGTVVGQCSNSIFVRWHQSCVEDELSPEEVQFMAKSTTERGPWRRKAAWFSLTRPARNLLFRIT